MHVNPRRPRLTPAVADVRRAVRDLLLSALTPAAPSAPRPSESIDVPIRARKAPGMGANEDVDQPADAGDGGGDGDGVGGAGDRAGALVLVGLSGGPDSVGLAAAVAFEAPRAGLRAGAVIVDHGLQAGSDAVAERASQQARELGLDPVLVVPVHVQTAGAGGPEASARAARYAAFERVAAETEAAGILLAHTLDDQAETVLLGLARGSGPVSLAGMRPVNGLYLRPLLGIRREVLHRTLDDLGLDSWHDPQNDDAAFARVRARQNVLPVLERELGPGIADALARTAEQLREDSEALDALAEEWATEIVEHAEAGIALDVSGLQANPAALAQRIIRFVVLAEFGVSLSRVQTLAAMRLVTHWHGQDGVDVPGIRVTRGGGQLVFARTT